MSDLVLRKKVEEWRWMGRAIYLARQWTLDPRFRVIASDMPAWALRKRAQAFRVLERYQAPYNALDRELNEELDRRRGLVVA